MKKRVKHIAVAQCGKMLGGVYFLLSLPFIVFLIPLAIALDATLGVIAGVALVIICPVIYGLMAYLGGLLTAWLYNVVAARLGGFEFTTVEAQAEPA